VPAGWAAGQTWVRLCDPTKEPFEAAWAALRLATFAFVVDPPCAPEHVARARRLGAPLANPALDIHITVVTGMLERAAGHYVAALVHFRRATELAAETGNLYLEGLATLSIGFMAPRMDAVDAAKALHDALTRLYASRNWLNLWAVMEALALHWARTGHDERAAVLIGYLENGDIRHAVFVDRRQKAFAALRQSVDAEAWLAVGAGLDRDQVVAYALNELDDLPVENVAAANLTKREREIVTLVATGLTNQAIGEQLFISERTVDTHITSIRRKLGTTTRTQLAVWGLENLQN
jgi:DNA-binding CsgD family transcriptional regulator